MASEKKEKRVHKVVLKNVRLSFPKLWRPDVGQRDDGTTTRKYKANFLIDKKKQKALIQEINDAIQDALEDKFGAKIPKLKPEKFCLRDGDDEEYDGYEGMMYLGASNSKKPPIVGRNKEPLSEDDGKPYAGCYVNAVVHIWVQNNEADKGGKRVNASLEAVQFVRDGEAFGAPAIDVDEVFDDLGEDDEDEAPKRSSRRSRPSDDDEDEAPRRRRSRPSDDDEDEAPRGRTRSKRDLIGDDDEDDEPAPRRRRKPVEDDEIPF